MRTIELFRRAKNIYQGGGVKKSGESEKKIYFEVTDLESKKVHQVTFSQTTKGWVMNCEAVEAEDDCTSRSLSKGSPHFCAHILAAIFKMEREVKIQ